jgi:hypothetical protein
MKKILFLLLMFFSISAFGQKSNYELYKDSIENSQFATVDTIHDTVYIEIEKK